MGLSSYKGEEVRKSDVTVAKNYLNQDEISELNPVVNMWLDYVSYFLDCHFQPPATLSPTLRAKTAACRQWFAALAAWWYLR